MKKTLLITEEERKRISILHENAIKRQHLSEEVPLQLNAAQMLNESNPKVAQIQKKLMDMGYSQLLGPKRDDGVLGPKTLDAILTALSSSEKLTTNMSTNQPKIESPSATAELKPSAINEPQNTPVNATRGGSGMAQIAADDAKQAQVTAAQPAATGGNTPQVTNQVANKTKEQPKNTQDFDNEIE